MARIIVHFLGGGSKFIDYGVDTKSVKDLLKEAQESDTYCTSMGDDESGYIIFWRNVTHIEYDY